MMTASHQRHPLWTEELSARRRLYALASILLVLPIVLLVYRPAAHGLDITGHQIGRDFINVWAGPQLALGGALQTLFDLHAYHEAIGRLFGQPLPFHNWGYPLFTLLVFWPLAQLPYFWALTVWTVGGFAIFAVIALAPLERGRRVGALLLLFAAPACLINIVAGQNGFISAALFIGGILWLDRHPVAAGVLFGLLTFKPHLGILLPFVLVALGAWRTIASAAITAVVLVGVSLAAFGVDPWIRYLDVSGSYQMMLLQRFYGFYTYMMASVLAGGRVFGLSYHVALLTQILVAVPAVAVSVWAVRKTADPCQRVFVLATAALLVTPYAFNYDLAAVAVVLVWLLHGRLAWRPRLSVVYLLAWIMPVGLMYFNWAGLGLFPLVSVALFGVAVDQAVRGTPARGLDPREEPSPAPV